MADEQRKQLEQAIAKADNASTPYQPDLNYAAFMADRLAPLIEHWIDEAACNGATIGAMWRSGRPPHGWTERVEWEVLLPANAFRPEPRWAPATPGAPEAWLNDEPARSRRVWTEPWTEDHQ